MKPVEIEFIMRDKLSPGIDKAGKSAETLGDKAEQVSKSITDRIAAQKEQIKYVESCLKDLKKQYDNLAPGKAQLEMRAEIDACTKALQEDKNILSSLEAEHDKASVSTQTSFDAAPGDAGCDGSPAFGGQTEHQRVCGDGR